MAFSEFNEQVQPDQLRLRIFRLGSIRFALFAGEVEAVVDWQRPTPLPAAPEAILGIMAAQARMITILDTSRLLQEPGPGDAERHGCVIVLRGHEQLGLVASAEEAGLEISLADLEAGREPAPLVGHVSYQKEKIPVLDPARLFTAAIRGQERRQRQL